MENTVNRKAECVTMYPKLAEFQPLSEAYFQAIDM